MRIENHLFISKYFLRGIFHELNNYCAKYYPITIPY